MKIEAHTYQEWLKLGFHVMRGQNSTGRNLKGECTFTSWQVAPNNNNFGNEDQDDYGMDDTMPGNPNDYGDSD